MSSWVEPFCLFDLILYLPVNNFSVMLGRVFLGWTSTKQGLMCFVQVHNAVTLVRLDPTALRSRVKCSTTEPLRSLWVEQVLSIVQGSASSEPQTSTLSHCAPQRAKLFACWVLFCRPLLSKLTFFKISLRNRTLSENQTIWIQIWVQTVTKGNEIVNP